MAIKSFLPTVEIVMLLVDWQVCFLLCTMTICSVTSLDLCETMQTGLRVSMNVSGKLKGAFREKQSVYGAPMKEWHSEAAAAAAAGDEQKL